MVGLNFSLVWISISLNILIISFWFCPFFVHFHISSEPTHRPSLFSIYSNMIVCFKLFLILRVVHYQPSNLTFDLSSWDFEVTSCHHLFFMGTLVCAFSSGAIVYSYKTDLKYKVYPSSLLQFNENMPKLKKNNLKTKLKKCLNQFILPWIFGFYSSTIRTLLYWE